MNMMPQEMTTPSAARLPALAPVTLAFAPDWPVHVVLFRVAGTALILSASGMWLMPDAMLDGRLLLLKLGLSVFFFFAGLALLMRNHQDTRPDACFDPVRAEVRVLRKNDRGVPQTVLRRGYDSLGRAAFSSNAVELFDIEGRMLMRLVIDDSHARQSLRCTPAGVGFRPGLSLRA